MIVKLKFQFLICTLALLFSASHALARGSDISFRGTVTRIDQTSAGHATVAVRLVGFDVPVQVNPETDIEVHGDSVGLAGLRVGNFVRVHGNFGVTGIVAREIHILDAEDGEFRLKGRISSVVPSGPAIVITVLGVQVVVDASTAIVKRGPGGSINLGQIAAGMEVDVRGSQQGGLLVASRILIGPRDDEVARVRFEGKITALEAGRILVDTQGGGAAVVLISDSTRVKGTLAVGVMVEVKGTLNPQLQVVADTIKVDGEEEKKDEAKFRKEIRLEPVAAGLGLKGEAEIEIEHEGSRVEQEFEVEIEKAQAGTGFGIRVEVATAGFVDFGTVIANPEGKAKAKFSTEPKPGTRDLRPFLPAGRDVRDFLRVRIIALDGTLLLEGRF